MDARLSSLSVVALLSLAVIVGCAHDGGRDGEPIWRGTIDTLDGGIIHVRNPAASVWDKTRAWTLEEELRIGALEGPEPEMFGSIAAVSTDNRGNIYVLESQAQEIRVYTPDGDYRFTIGHKGSGPGELKGAFGLAWDEHGRLWVPDAGNVRYLVFDSLGTLQKEYRRPLGPVYPFLGLFDVSGRLVDLTASASAQQLDLIPVSFDPELETFEYWAPVTHRAYFGPAPRGIVRVRPRQTLSISPAGFLWFGSTGVYRIYQRTLQGDTLRIVERPSEAVELSDSEREAILKELAEFPLRVDPGLIPTHKPAFNRMVLDTAGYLFVNVPGIEEQVGRLIDVFDPEGRYLGRMTSPVRLDWSAPPEITEDYFLGVAKDELDVSYVVRLRLTRPYPP